MNDLQSGGNAVTASVGTHVTRFRDRVSRWAYEAVPACVLILLSIALFRRHILGTYTFLGNPDRLNNHLKILMHHVDGLASGHLSAWSEFDLLGYDTFALPYTFPNPLTWITYWFGPENIYITAGFVATGLLACSGICAYAFVRSVARDRAAALVAAILYQFAAITVLKISQNDMSFAVFILIPLFALAVRRIGQRNLASSFLFMSLLAFVLLQFTFLQKAAYAAILIGAYALYRSWATRDWRPIFIAASSMVTGAVAAFPRLYSLAIAMGQYTRGDKGLGPQPILPFEILRWFDGTLFGQHFSEATAVVNGLNLSEGFLLYTAAFTPFLLIFGIVRYRSQWFGLAVDKQRDGAFFLLFLVFCFSVIGFPPVLKLIYLLFLKVDFLHGRILIAGLLPLVVLIALVLADLRPSSLPQSSNRAIGSWLIALVAGISIVVAIELIAGTYVGAWRPVQKWSIHLNLTAVARIIASAAVFSVVFAAIKSNRPRWARTGYQIMCVMLAAQTFAGVNYQINGVHTLSEIPFEKGNFYSAPRSMFHPPASQDIERLHQRLQSAQFRSIVICDPRNGGGFCAAHIGQYWRLRLVDGYYGMGVSSRIAALPWKAGQLGMREVMFTSRESLPWRLLALLNVKYALLGNNRLYRNAADGTVDSPGSGTVSETGIMENPFPVTARVFFPKAIERVADFGDAADKIFRDNKVADVTERSFVEGFSLPHSVSSQGRISLSGEGDRLDIRFDPANEERFLVVNELYYPGWRAEINAVPTVIYPTNVVMRGLLVPPGANAATLIYVAFTKSPAALWFYLAGLAALVIGTTMLWRGARTR
jgi:hypothetical protein